ncbi:hypothetical protein D3C86_1871710 [compost metagenome]
MICWPPVMPWEPALITTGFCLRSLARSAEVMTIATAPSDSWQQSSKCSGSQIQREAWCSSSVIGLPWKNACGLVAAKSRTATATRPKSSEVAP